jgi:hypothetical protein
MDKNSPKNAYISKSESIADGVVVRMLLEDGEPRIQMVLVIDRNTNYDSISQNRKNIKFLLNHLDNNQGSDLNIDYKENLYGLLQWHEEGFGRGRLVMILNYLCIGLTYSAYDSSQNEGEPKMKLNESQELISDPSFISSFGGYGLLCIFFALGKTWEDFNSWMEQGYENLSKDRLELGISGEPFRTEVLRGRIRYFKDCIKKGKITISDNDLRWNSLEFDIYYLYQKGYFTKVNELLDNEGRKEWLRNKLYIQKRVAMIIEKWECSQDPKIIIMRENTGKN